MSPQSLASTLNDLIDTSKDGDEGFRMAADETKNAELQAIFIRRSQDCASAATDLHNLVKGLGCKPETAGSATGAMDRGWVDLKAAASSRSDLAILEECERGEDVAKERYRKALEEESLPEDIRTVVQRQYDGVVRNHDQIRSLRDRFGARAS